MGLGTVGNSTLNGNFSISTARRLVNKNADENMLLAGSNMTIKNSTWQELFLDCLKVVCTAGLFLVYRAWKADDKVSETIEFAYKFVSLETIPDTNTGTYEIRLNSGDTIHLCNGTRDDGLQIVQIAFNSSNNFVELCEGSLNNLRERFVKDYNSRQNADLYKKFSKLPDEDINRFNEVFSEVVENSKSTTPATSKPIEFNDYSTFYAVIGTTPPGYTPGFDELSSIRLEDFTPPSNSPVSPREEQRKFTSDEVDYWGVNSFEQTPNSIKTPAEDVAPPISNHNNDSEIEEKKTEDNQDAEDLNGRKNCNEKPQNNFKEAGGNIPNEEQPPSQVLVTDEVEPKKTDEATETIVLEENESFSDLFKAIFEATQERHQNETPPRDSAFSEQASYFEANVNPQDLFVEESTPPTAPSNSMPLTKVKDEKLEGGTSQIGQQDKIGLGFNHTVGDNQTSEYRQQTLQPHVESTPTIPRLSARSSSISIGEEPKTTPTTPEKTSKESRSPTLKSSKRRKKSSPRLTEISESEPIHAQPLKKTREEWKIIFQEVVKQTFYPGDQPIEEDPKRLDRAVEKCLLLNSAFEACLEPRIIESIKKDLSSIKHFQELLINFRILDHLEFCTGWVKEAYKGANQNLSQDKDSLDLLQQDLDIFLPAVKKELSHQNRQYLVS